MTSSASWAAEESAFITAATVSPIGDGLLNGWSVAVKDNIDVGGLQTTGGTRFLDGNIAQADAEVVQRIRGAGGIIVGKTRMHELGHGITGVNPSYGTTPHPEDPTRTVGGSSGGSALAVMRGEARVALGTDTGGSARIPAAFTGIVGFRPSAGRYSPSGVLRISPTRDTVGLLAKTVSDVALLDSVIADDGGRSAELRVISEVAGIRIGVPMEARAGLSAALCEVFEAALGRLRQAGVEIVEISQPRYLEEYFGLGITVLRSETIPAISEYMGDGPELRQTAALIEASESRDVQEILRSALNEPELLENYEAALGRLEVLGRGYRSELHNLGVSMLAYPTTAVEPPLLEQGEAAHAAAELRATVLLATPATLAGTPAVSIPSGRSPESGLPVGLTLEHVDQGEDAELLAVAELVTALLSGIDTEGHCGD